MKCIRTGPFVGAASIALMLLATTAIRAAETETRTFHAIDQSLVNPQRGFFINRQIPDDSSRFDYAAGYYRFDWQDLEPHDGQYNFLPIEEAIAGWGKKGVPFAFRIMTANAHTDGYYCSPKWLFDGGCRSFVNIEKSGDPTKAANSIPRVEPDYSDPRFLKKHGQFISALARRYDGNPAIAFIDIGSYGIWGEWHTEHPSPWETRKQIIDMYLNAFHKTRLISMSDDAEALDYAINHGCGIRRDGVGSPWHETSWIGSEKYARVKGLTEQWKQAPVVFEFFGDYPYMTQQGWSFEKALQFMKANHVSWINDNIGQVPPDAMKQLVDLETVAGYRLALRQVTLPRTVSGDRKIAVEMHWSNLGVAPPYQRYPLVLFLLNSQRKAVYRQEQPVDVTKWLPGDITASGSIQAPPDLGAGEYEMGLALVDPRSGKPAIALACDAPSHGRLYTIGSIRLP